MEKFHPSEIEVLYEILSEQELQERVRTPAAPFYYCILDSEGYIFDFGFVVDQKRRQCLRVVSGYDGVFFDVGYHGTYIYGQLEYYVPGHEEHTPIQENASHDEFLKFFHRELRNVFDIFANSYYRERARENMLAQMKAKKELRAKRTFQVVLIAAITLLIFYLVTLF